MGSAFVASAGLEAAPLQDGSVLFDPKTGKFIMLNRSAALLWSQLSTPRTEDDLFGLLGTAFPDAAIPRQHVTEALDQLQRMGIVSAGGADAAAPAVGGSLPEKKEGAAAYEPPSLRVLGEDELLNIFQMTAAEISVAACWWAACPTGCP